jgi:hypothetical protein
VNPMLTVYLDGLSVLVCLRPVSCVSNVDSVSGLSVHDCHFGVF